MNPTQKYAMIIGSKVIENWELQEHINELEKYVETLEKQNRDYRKQHDMVLAKEQTHNRLKSDISSLESQLSQQKSINAEQARELSLYSKNKQKLMIEGGSNK